MERFRIPRNMGSCRMYLAQVGEPERFSQWSELLCPPRRTSELNLIDSRARRYGSRRICSTSVGPGYVG
jgi:hypothetical protein